MCWEFYKKNYSKIANHKLIAKIGSNVILFQFIVFDILKKLNFVLPRLPQIMHRFWQTNGNYNTCSMLLTNSAASRLSITSNFQKLAENYLPVVAKMAKFGFINFCQDWSSNIPPTANHQKFLKIYDDLTVTHYFLICVSLQLWEATIHCTHIH